jgi:hypothetical protein
MVLVDGKQRLTSALMFLANEIPVFGHYLEEFDDPVDVAGAIGLSGASFRMQVNNLTRREDLLRWYLDLNDGGTVHTSSELRKVRRLLTEARKDEPWTTMPPSPKGTR